MAQGQTARCRLNAWHRHCLRPWSSRESGVQAELGNNTWVMATWPRGHCTKRSCNAMHLDNTRTGEEFSRNCEHTWPPDPRFHSALAFHHVVGEHRAMSEQQSCHYFVFGGAWTLLPYFFFFGLPFSWVLWSTSSFSLHFHLVYDIWKCGGVLAVHRPKHLVATLLGILTWHQQIYSQRNLLI